MMSMLHKIQMVLINTHFCLAKLYSPYAIREHLEVSEHQNYHKNIVRKVHNHYLCSIFTPVIFLDTYIELMLMQ